MNLSESLSHDVSDSVQLSLLNEADAPSLFALTHQNRERLREWLPWLDTVQREEDTLQFIRASKASAEAGKELVYAIRHQGVVTGVITLFLEKRNRCATIGYWLGKEHEGQGLIVRSCVVLLSHIFLHLEYHRAEVRVAPANTRSRAIPQKLGFRIDGTLRDSEWLYDHYKDSVVYSLLKREWEQREEGYLFSGL